MKLQEIILKSLLVVVCLYLAGLNLWLLFKDWLHENFEKRRVKQNNSTIKNKPKLDERDIPSFVGKSKTDIRLLDSIKKKQQQKEEKNDVNLEEEFIPMNSKMDAIDIHLSGTQSATIDEFELMARSLQGKPISRSEQSRIAQTILKTRGTDLFGQMVSQIQGAKELALNILKESESDENSSSNNTTNLDKYIRL